MSEVGSKESLKSVAEKMKAATSSSTLSTPSLFFSTSSSSPRCPNSSISFRKPIRCSSSSSASSSPSLVIEATQNEIGDETSIARRLILLRHADSSWEDRSLRDHDRPLSKAGRTDAIDVSQRLLQLGWVPELILSSNAARTKETLKIMQEHTPEFLKAEVHFISSFYSIAAMDGQTAEHLRQAICEYSRDEIFTVMCMGHNRGWEEAASVFSGSSIELKTCNAALLEANGKTWDEAFALAGFGGWKLHGIVKPNGSL